MPPTLRVWVGWSLVGHLLFVTFLVVSVRTRAGIEHKARTVLTTKLVRLGKKRPEKYLPRKVAPAPAGRRAPSAKPAAAPKSPKKEDLPSAAERLRAMGGVREALERLKKRAPPAEGSPEGSARGTVSDLKRALLGDRFATEVYRCLKANYAIEAIDPARVAGRRVRVLIRVGADGSFLDARILESSGASFFDAAVRRAIKRCGKVGPPPAEITAEVMKEGVEVEFQP